MKLLFAFILLFSNSLFAQKPMDEPPEALKDAVITVTLVNGRTYQFDANTWKLSRRNSPNQAIACVKCEPKIVEVIKQVPVEVIKEVEKPVEVIQKVRSYYKHSVSGLLGRGPIGIRTISKNENETKVEKQYGFVLGARYGYALDTEYQLNVEYLTNNTLMTGVTWGF